MAERASTSRRSIPADENLIGQFIKDDAIGKGSFAQVYSGRHRVTGELVAIKAVDLSRLNKKLKDNLHGEIKILKALHHPHIVALHDCVETPSHINLIMEFCELGDLSLFIKKRDKLGTNQATHDMARKYPNAPNSGLNEVLIRHFLKQLASALHFLRDHNLIHRDVKPQNLLLLPSPMYRDSHKMAKQIMSASAVSLTPATGLASLPMLKLADFGFARHLPSTALAETLCGSPLYMAPEILRYEKYDAKADLWSVGTVLYEMVTGKPPFRAHNHVDLLRRIETTDDQIRFPQGAVVSQDMKWLIRQLLKKNAPQRISFEHFFSHSIIVGPIPGLVEDDIPKEERRISRQIREAMRTEEPTTLPARRSSFRRYPATENDSRDPRDSGATPSSPRTTRISPLATPIEDKPNPLEQALTTTTTTSRLSYSPRGDGEGLGIRRPSVQPSTSAPGRPAVFSERRRGYSTTTRPPASGRQPPSPTSSVDEAARARFRTSSRALRAEREQAAQDVAFERDYVVIDRNYVEVNALADLIGESQPPISPKSGQIVRRATSQGNPTSTTGAVPSPPSRHHAIAAGRADSYRPAGSLDKTNMSSSPGSMITKAIQDAGVRLYGIKNFMPHLLGKGHSPPQIYSPFSYPPTASPVGLIGDGKPVDEDARVIQCLEEFATLSDVVYGFAEVKYRQLVPPAPSMEHGLGGVPTDQMASEEDDGLTVEAVVALSEEALVLYTKALTLLYKCIHIAGLWWQRKANSSSSAGGSLAPAMEVNTQTMHPRIVSAAQWSRARYNESLEKTEMVRRKLQEAQKQLPEDHPNHPSSYKPTESAAGGAGDGLYLSPGLSAEKLMYERAVEMSRAAAINEIANEDLVGCELSYTTAVRMLEAVLDNDEELLTKRRVSSAAAAVKDETTADHKDLSSEINHDDQQAVQKMIDMIKGRLATVRKRLRLIAAAEKAQAQAQQQQQLARRRSGEGPPRSVPPPS